MEEIKFTIPVRPITKKNSSQIFVNKKNGKPFITPSPQYKEYEKEALQFIPKLDTIDYPINLKCVFYMPTHRACDLVNLLQAISDILVKSKLLEDDNFNILASYDGSRVRYDKGNPRTEIEITRAVVLNVP